jgi:aminopeptidase YwaD
MKHVLVALIGCFLCIQSYSQDRSFVSAMIDSLCAPHYHGRGYVEDGDAKAATFIQKQVELLGVDQPIQVQEFELGVNTFPGEMTLQVNGTPLIPGKDFIIDPKSGKAKGTYEVVTFKPKWADNHEKLFSRIADGTFNGKVVVFDTDDENINYQNLIDDVYKNPLKAVAYIILTDKKLTWSVSRSMVSFPIFRVQKSATSKKIKAVEINVDQLFKSNHFGKNVMAVLPGTSDSSTNSLVYTAHLDHLGHMGSATYIAGANDNASGSAMLLDLYKSYYTNRPAYDVVFIWFGAEEAGLVGSKYFVENPLIELESISFLLNLDLMGDAKTGITVVNGKVFEDHFAKLSSLNMELALLEKVKARGPAANSDHHPFYEKGVPSFFIYTTGEYTHYHDIDDVPGNLPLTNYEKVFELITEFAKTGI